MKLKQIQLYDKVFLHGVATVVTKELLKLFCEYSGEDMGAVEPVPLDEKILELNGFVKGAYNGAYLHPNFPLGVYPEQSGTWFDYDMSDTCNFNCRYVHELQHVLRVSGCEDLANNILI